jgi:hypothetical protein
MIVSTPDGSRVHFPDGTPTDEVERVMRSNFGGPPKADAAEPESPVRAQVRKEHEALKKAGVPMGEAYSRRIMKGLTFGAGDDILAIPSAIIEMAKRKTWNPLVGWEYAKAQQDLLDEDSKASTGLLGMGAEILGGAGSGLSLARNGITAFGLLGRTPSVAGKAAAAATDGLALGTVSGAMEGNSLDERTSNALVGGAFGGVLGGALPLAGHYAVNNPIVSNIRAWLNPTNYATNVLAQDVRRSGMTPRQINQAVEDAAADGQGMFTAADAMGITGQRSLARATRAPGDAQQFATEFLDNRQVGQGRRVANTLHEGFGRPQTAQQTEAAMTQARDDWADIAYPAGRHGARPVDLTGAVANIDDTLQPGAMRFANPQANIADDSIESVLRRYRGRMTDDRSMLTDYTAIERLRREVADAAQAAVRQGRGNEGRMLGNLVREMDTALESASPGFRAANNRFRQESRNIEQVAEGRAGAMRGRSEDTIPAYNSQTPAGQRAYRAGYVDPLIADAQGAAVGANKARPLTSDAFRDEAAAFNPADRANRMFNRLDRENTMFETRRHATGGSLTDQNLMGQGDIAVDPGLFTNLIRGNFVAAAQRGLGMLANGWSGNTEAVRTELARMLLTRGTARNMEGALAEATRRIERLQQTMLLTSRAAMGGAAGGAGSQ